MGGWDRTVDMLPSPEAKNWPVPLLTGFGGGHDVDLRRMAADGICLLGHLQSLQQSSVVVAPDLTENLTKGDEWFTNFKKSVDEYVANAGLAVPQESHSGDGIAEPIEVSSPILNLNLMTNGINSIVWATGFRFDFSWVKIPVFDENGEPIHRRGVTASPGIYFLGLKWLYKLKSAFLSIAGPAEDAAYLAEVITAGRKQG